MLSSVIFIFISFNDADSFEDPPLRTSLLARYNSISFDFPKPYKLQFLASIPRATTNDVQLLKTCSAGVAFPAATAAQPLCYFP